MADITPWTAVVKEQRPQHVKQSPCRFFDLPRELRSRIYIHATNPRTSRSYPVKGDRIRYTVSNNFLPSLRLVSHTFKDEYEGEVFRIMGLHCRPDFRRLVQTRELKKVYFKHVAARLRYVECFLHVRNYDLLDATSDQIANGMASLLIRLAGMFPDLRTLRADLGTSYLPFVIADYNENFLNIVNMLLGVGNKIKQRITSGRNHDWSFEHREFLKTRLCYANGDVVQNDIFCRQVGDCLENIVLYKLVRPAEGSASVERGEEVELVADPARCFDFDAMWASYRSD